MNKKKEVQNVKINLTIPIDFYKLLMIKSSNDYMKVSTWVKQQLMKTILEGELKNNEYEK